MLTKRFYRLSIDRINGRFMSGWCFHRWARRSPVTITVSVDDCELGSVVCHEYRRDLKEHGLHPTGRCGFDFSFPKSFVPREHQRLQFFFNNSRRPHLQIPCRDLELLQPDNGRPIFFMHIPKTAGTSFNAFARRCFSGEEYIPHLERLAPDEQRRAVVTGRYLSGHLPWREALTLLDGDRHDLYALIREPYAHLHSHINYVRRVHLDAEHELYFAYHHNETIKAMAEHLAGVNFHDDRHLQRFVDGISGCQCDFFDNIQTRFFLSSRPERVGEAEFQEAAENLRRFRLVGLTEHYDRFRDRFCQDIGLQPQQQTLRSNRSKGYALFDVDRPAVRALVDPLVRFDCRLYALIAERFSREEGDLRQFG
jgi:hypothetical protein